MRKNKFHNYNIWVLVVVIISLLLAFVTNTFFVLPVQIVGDSMVPTYEDDDWVLVNRRAYYDCNVEVGDVIVFYKQDISNELIIKRVVQMPEELVGNAPQESYFVVGDNDTESIDSRVWEDPYVQKDMIVGKVIED